MEEQLLRTKEIWNKNVLFVVVWKKKTEIYHSG